MNLREMREKNGIPTKDIIAVVQSLYPKYDKQLQSKCENGDKYGIRLREDAEQELILRYGIVEPLKAPKRDSHKLKYKVQCRLSESEYKALQQQIKADGFDTMQAFLAFMLRRYLKGEIKCHI